MFYLNYEGCKQIYRYYMMYIVNSFIWTMRDVNDLKNTEASSPFPSFIWTMRDVNANNTPNNIISIMFYLNYEGCKQLLRERMRSMNNLFYLNYEGCKRRNCSFFIIRTNLFYLNYEGCKPSLTSTPKAALCRFIWTMRDVNSKNF